MSSSTYNINDILEKGLPDASNMRIGIVVSEWNDNITQELLNGAVETLKRFSVKDENILVKSVPGSFELIFGASQMIRSGLVDGVIAIGCIIRGATPHFDFISTGTTDGLAALNRESDIPVIFGVLTTNNLEQAEERAGGILGNKGEEYAATAIKMIDFARSLGEKS